MTLLEMLKLEEMGKNQSRGFAKRAYPQEDEGFGSETSVALPGYTKSYRVAKFSRCIITLSKTTRYRMQIDSV
jgi:hypothetical protein